MKLVSLYSTVQELGQSSLVQYSFTFSHVVVRGPRMAEHSPNVHLRVDFNKYLL